MGECGESRRLPPAAKLQFNEAHDWWSKWKGADYLHGWDVLGQLGTVNQYKSVGCGGPTLYRHNEAANLVFYDGHVETRHKTKVWVPEHVEIKPYQPGASARASNACRTNWMGILLVAGDDDGTIPAVGGKHLNEHEQLRRPLCR